MFSTFLTSEHTDIHGTCVDFTTGCFPKATCSQRCNLGSLLLSRCSDNRCVIVSTDITRVCSRSTENKIEIQSCFPFKMLKIYDYCKISQVSKFMRTTCFYHLATCSDVPPTEMLGRIQVGPVHVWILWRKPIAGCIVDLGEFHLLFCLFSRWGVLQSPLQLQHVLWDWQCPARSWMSVWPLMYVHCNRSVHLIGPQLRLDCWCCLFHIWN